MNIASRNGFHCALVALCCSICAISTTYAPAVMAQDPSGSSLKRSTIELRGNIGRIDAEDDDVFDDLDDIDTAHAALGYWFNFNQNFSIGVSYLDGESDDYEFGFFGLLNDSVLEYNSFIASVEGRLPLGRENYLFARLGASFYDYDVVDEDDNETLRADDGTDFHFAAGWRKQWSSGFGMEVLYEYLPLGEEIELNTIGLGVTFAF